MAALHANISGLQCRAVRNAVTMRAGMNQNMTRGIALAARSSASFGRGVQQKAKLQTVSKATGRAHRGSVLVQAAKGVVRKNTDLDVEVSLT